MRSLLLLFCLISCSLQNEEFAKSTGAKNSPSISEPQIPFNPERYVCYKTGMSINIDGKMSESIWQHAEWTKDFVDIEGQLKPKPRFRTRAKMLWDDHYFYIFAEMEEPDVWATLRKRDSIIFYDNDFEVFIDPNGDTHQYYELEVNAFSTEWDLLLVKPYRDGAPAVNSWDIQGFKTAVHVDGTINNPKDRDNGWTLEIAIPWKVLKECAHKEAPPEPGHQWRVGFSSVEWLTKVKNGKYVKVINPETNKPFPEDNWVWSPQGLINMHYPEMWGFVQFSDKIVGSGTEKFKFKKEENAKWGLRQVYYKQKSYYMNRGKYTDDVAALGSSDLKIQGYLWPPVIEHTSNVFEAWLESEDGSEKWYICQDGRVWK